MKQLKISFENGEEIHATLLEKSAPQTCKTVWESLPFQSVITQSRWSGREINLDYDNSGYPMRENQTIYTSKGKFVTGETGIGRGMLTLPKLLQSIMVLN